MSLLFVQILFNPRAALEYKNNNKSYVTDKCIPFISQEIHAERCIIIQKTFSLVHMICCIPDSLPKDADELIKSTLRGVSQISFVLDSKEITNEEALNFKIENKEDKDFLDEFLKRKTSEKSDTPPASQSVETKTETTPETKPEPKPESPFDKIENLIGAEELKAWAREMKTVKEKLSGRPMYQQAIYGMSYLVTVNPGSGGTLCFNLMAEVIKDMLGLSTYTLQELTCRFSSQQRDRDINDRLYSTISSIRRSEKNLCTFVIHIDEMQGHTSSDLWKKLMDAAQPSRDNALFIFTVNNTDMDVLMQLKKKIDDVQCTRVIKIGPPTNENHFDMFCQYLSRFGVSVDESAYSILLRKLAEEKSDGRFYSYKTVRKIADELLYCKLKNYAAGKTDNDNIITGKDISELLYSKVLDTDEKTGFDQLDSLVSLQNVKDIIREIVAAIKMQRSYDTGMRQSMHMMFYGAPGTGKTVVARILGRIMREEGLLSIGDFYEVTSKDLIGEYVGQTAPKTAEACRSAYGSVLFIDEAYALADNDQNSYCREAIATLIAEMENNRDNLVVIFAGYEDELEKLFTLNPGLRDRIPYKVQFNSYTRDELRDIFYSTVPESFEYNDRFKVAADKFFKNIEDSVFEDKNFSNGRYIRNIIERIISKAALRLMSEEPAKGEKVMLTDTDFELAVSDISSQQLNAKKSLQKLGF